NEMDSVTFDDTVANTPANTAVSLSTFSLLSGTNVLNSGIKPLSVTVVSTNNNYLFMGAGKLSGPLNLVKKGPSTLTISNGPNDFIGTIVVSGGKLVLNNNAGLGNPATTVFVTNGATLDVGGSTLTVLNANAANFSNQVFVAGAGVGGNGVIVSSSTNGQNNALHSVTLLGDTTIGGPGI